MGRRRARRGAAFCGQSWQSPVGKKKGFPASNIFARRSRIATQGNRNLGKQVPWRLMIPNPREAPAVGPLRSAVMVVPSLADAGVLRASLPAAEFDVTVVHTFFAAKALLDAQPPDVLVTDLRLGEYNGLHLVLRGKAIRQDLAAVVLSDFDAPAFQVEAESQGATFVVKPVSPRDLAAAVARTLYRRAGDAHAVRPPFERRSVDRRTATSSIPPTEERRRSQRRRGRFPAAYVELA